VCLEKVQEEVGDVLQLVWKSYLLRPYPEPKPMDKFRRYTESWLRPAGHPDAGEFRVWATEEAPPSHSIPPNIAVKASAKQGAFDRYHRALMHAYFARNLDVTSRHNILLVAGETGLDLPAFERHLDDPATSDEVVADHNEAVELGISGVPCVVLEGGFMLPGSQERAVYRNIVQRLLAKRGSS
jgi:predicted DsbA family dithiol-disulfide isomerase